MINIVTGNDLLFDDVIKQLPNNMWNPPDYSDDYYAQRPIDEGIRDRIFPVKIGKFSVKYYIF